MIIVSALFAPSTAVHSAHKIHPAQGVIFPTSSINSVLVKSFSVAKANQIALKNMNTRMRVFIYCFAFIYEDTLLLLWLLYAFYTRYPVLQGRILDLLKSFAREKLIYILYLKRVAYNRLKLF